MVQQAVNATRDYFGILDIYAILKGGAIHSVMALPYISPLLQSEEQRLYA